MLSKTAGGTAGSPQRTLSDGATGQQIPLTVAIPTFNRRTSVVALVQAIQTQLRAGDELLVVDDGSTDGTSEALDANPAVRLLRHQSNQGIVATWNACLSSAARDWVCIVHDDDLVAGNALDVIRHACWLAGGPAVIAHCSVDPKTDSRFRCRVLEPGPWAVLHAAFVPSGTTVHRDVVASLGVFDQRFTYSPDLEYFARICARYMAVVVESPQVVQQVSHQRNYQYLTWYQADFFPQLEEVERLVIEYAALAPDTAKPIFQRRMIAHARHMLSRAVRLRDGALMKRVSSLVWRRPYLGLWTRSAAGIIGILGWIFPAR
jgi:glycosyltransferase involved in cell wall biosynthesis